MPKLDIQKQAYQLTSKIRENVDQLPPTDPTKPWFSVELDKIAVTQPSGQHSLEENNARISALRQLYHVLFQHCVRKQSPTALPSEALDEASFQTIQARLPKNVLDSTRKHNFSIEPSLLHDDSQENKSFDPVSPTAKIVSYLRSMDPALSFFEANEFIDQGKEFFEQLGSIDVQTKELMAVMFQSRYHAVNVAIQHHNSAQTIEFASGISPRGFQWSRNSPGTIYVESDLPRLMVRKAKLVRDSLVNSTTKNHGLLHCCGVDVLDESSLRGVLESIDTEHPFTLVTEGLLLYFSEEELSRFLTIIKNVLEEFLNAVWISDLVSTDDLNHFTSCHPGVAAAVKEVFGRTGRSVLGQNPFKNASAFTDYLKRFNLRIDSQTNLRSTLGSTSFRHSLHEQQMLEVVGDRSVYTVKSLNATTTSN